MKLRIYPLGTRNLVGAQISKIRMGQHMKQKEVLAKLRVHGIDMAASSLSKIEGQTRSVTDIEVVAFSDILNVPISNLFVNKAKIHS